MERYMRKFMTWNVDLPLSPFDLRNFIFNVHRFDDPCISAIMHLSFWPYTPKNFLSLFHSKPNAYITFNLNMRKCLLLGVKPQKDKLEPRPRLLHWWALPKYLDLVAEPVGSYVDVVTSSSLRKRELFVPINRLVEFHSAHYFFKIGQGEMASFHLALYLF